MSKVQFGEFAAFRNKGGIRFQKNNKLVAEATVPPEVVQYLKKNLGEDVKQYAPPTEEQKIQLKEESMQVKPELELTPEQMAEKVAKEQSEPITQDDFDEAPPVPDFNEVDEVDPDPQVADDPHAGFMESVSIHTAAIEDIAQALYERFGIYTVYLNKLPVADEINPLTAEPFTKYHQGIAYQAAIRAQQTGILNRPQEEGRKQIDKDRVAHSEVQKQFEPIPGNMHQHARQNTFAYRTAPEGTRTIAETRIEHVLQEDGTYRAVQVEIPKEQRIKNNAGVRMTDDQFTDEPIVEPRFGKKVIRPDW